MGRGAAAREVGAREGVGREGAGWAAAVMVVGAMVVVVVVDWGVGVMEGAGWGMAAAAAVVVAGVAAKGVGMGACTDQANRQTHVQRHGRHGTASAIGQRLDGARLCAVHCMHRLLCPCSRGPNACSGDMHA